MVGVVVVAILVQGGRAGQQAALKTDIAALGLAALGLAALGSGWMAQCLMSQRLIGLGIRRQERRNRPGSQFQKPRPSLVHSEW